MQQSELDKILEEHLEWLKSAGKRGSRADLIGADLRGANLYKANLYKADLYKANLYGADLYGADLTGANLTGANLTGAYLRRAYLVGANLTGANLTGANLTKTNLTGAYLKEANLTGANLTHIKGKFIFTFQIGKDFAYYTDGYLKIGCECHPLEEWLENYEEIGQKADYTEKDIKNYGKVIHVISTLSL